MKVLVTGAAGQLGRALQETRPAGVELIALGRAELDLADAPAVRSRVESVRPDVVINAGAYTAVDRAESEPELARAVNADAVAAIAAACAAHGTRLVQVSTDFVFDGTASRPYRPTDATAPLSVYGATKRDGEEIALRLAPRSLVLRTAWVYAVEGRNFVATMLRAMRGGKPLRVVCDQIGTPTFAPNLARATWMLIARDASGVLHYTESGVASWYDFAVAIQEEALQLGLLAAPVPIEPITSAEYPTPARRPAFSVLDKSNTARLLAESPEHWRTALRKMMKAGNG